MFNLQKAIDTWRHQHTHSRVFKGRDLDELEQHLRDQVDYLKATGASEEEAFRSAIKELGSPVDTESEYRGVAWMKARDRRELSTELRLLGAMTTSYFKVAFRNLKKNRTSSIISLLSLAVAISVALTTFLFVEHVLVRDAFHENADEIFLIHQITQEESGDQLWGHTPQNLGPLLQDESTSITRVARFAVRGATIKADGRDFVEGVHFVDPEFLDMFTFPLASGTASALSGPGEVILSDRASTRLFGDESPIGKSISLHFDDDTIFEVTVSGVMERISTQSGIQFDFLAAYSVLESIDAKPADWSTFTSATFVQLDDAESAPRVEQQLNTFVDRVNAADEEWQISGFALDNLTQLARNRGNVNQTVASSVPWAPVIVLSLVSFLLVLMSCFNYMNITIAKSSKRLKEIGVRKVVGGQRKHLVFQFMAENIELCFVAVLIALLITWQFLLPGFNQIAGADISISLLNDGRLWVFLAVMVLGTGLLSGAYPALFISSFKPTAIFRGAENLNRGRPLTKALLTFQFVLAFMTMSAGIVFIMNGRYHASMDWGYELDQVLVYRATGEAERGAVLSAAEQTAGVIDLASTQSAIGIANSRFDAKIGDVEIRTSVYGVSPSYLDMLDVELSYGSRFSDPTAQLGKESVLVNETFVEEFSLNEAIGTFVTVDSTDYAIAGVLKDFHADDLFSVIQPMLFRLSDDSELTYVTMTIQAGSALESIASIQNGYENAFPGLEAKYYYGDRSFQNFVEESAGITTIFTFIAFLSLLISCLSIYALSSQNVTNRMKEIGIRKVLGGTPAGIAQLVNRKLFVFLTVASVIAAPAAFFGMDALLNDIYAYRMDLNVLPFIFTYLLIIATTALTISSQVRGINNAHPAEIMRID